LYKRLLVATLAGLWSFHALGQDEVGISDAWIRALPPTQPITAAYLTISNPGSLPVTVTGASTDIAGRVEIHTTREVDGLMRMEQLQQLDLPPASEVILSPGGTHLMLLDLKRMPAAGEAVSLCLQLSSAGPVCTEAIARKSADTGGGHQHHHHQE
jgi:hypothetical protein